MFDIVNKRLILHISNMCPVISDPLSYIILVLYWSYLNFNTRLSKIFVLFILSYIIHLVYTFSTLSAIILIPIGL